MLLGQMMLLVYSVLPCAMTDELRQRVKIANIYRLKHMRRWRRRRKRTRR